MRWLISKLVSGLILIYNPTIPGKYRWFIHQKIDSYLYQIKFLFKDYFFKKPYKTIIFNGEFQQEILYAIPFAHWHHQNGTLLKTVSSKYTKQLYYFSQNHIEKFGCRNHEHNSPIEIPNAAHNFKIFTHKWSPPNYKKQFENNIIKFCKPILIIANRFNTEWGSSEPISYFSIDNLNTLINTLSKKYQIIYNRPSSKNIVNDNSEILDFGDKNFIKKNHNKVLLLEDLDKIFDLTVDDFNHMQLMVYANCSNFISVHGGTATLCSMFGGENIILSKKGLEHDMKEFFNVFPKISRCKINHSFSFEEVTKTATEHYLFDENHK